MPIRRWPRGVKKKLIATLIYPAILVTLATIIVTYLVTYVVPQFAKLYADMQVQLPTRDARAAGSHGNLSALCACRGRCALFARLVGTFLWSRTENGGTALDRIKLKLPVVGEIWIKFQVAQFCRTLSTLLAGGTPLVGALSTSAESVRSRLISSAIEKASRHGARRPVAA